MRIPIDDNTIGYISSHPYSQGILRYKFNKFHEHSVCSRDKVQITFGEFKAKFNTTHTSTIESDPKFYDKINELYKDFVFKIPNK